MTAPIQFIGLKREGKWRRADGAEGTNKPKPRYCSGANDPPTFQGCFVAANLTKMRREGEQRISARVKNPFWG
jgi:hypothetical protein